MAWISSRESVSIPNNPCGTSACSLRKQNFFHSVDFLKFDFDDFVRGGLHRAADVTRLDGELAVSAVDQDQQLNPGGPAVIEQSVKRRPCGAPGVEHVIGQDHVFSNHRKWNFGGADDR